jgi:hypothetical protein
MLIYYQHLFSKSGQSHTNIGYSDATPYTITSGDERYHLQLLTASQ